MPQVVKGVPGTFSRLYKHIAYKQSPNAKRGTRFFSGNRPGLPDTRLCLPLRPHNLLELWVVAVGFERQREVQLAVIVIAKRYGLAQ